MIASPVPPPPITDKSCTTPSAHTLFTLAAGLQSGPLMEAWNLTAKTVMHVDEWKSFFAEVGYTGDYYWFIP